MDNLDNISAAIFVRPFEEIVADYIENVISERVPHENAQAWALSCIDALHAVNEYDINRAIALPQGASIEWPDGRVEYTCPAYAIIVRFELQRWLRPDWDMENKDKVTP